MVFLISAFQIIGALSERTQKMRPPSNASFTTADPRADGQADSRPRGHTRAPVPTLPDCLSEHLSVHLPMCQARLDGHMGVPSGWALNKQEC